MNQALLVALVLSSVALSPALSLGAGLPEPGLVLYGVIRNLDGRDDVRMAVGTLRCEITPPSGPPVVLVTNLQNINDQFSYVLLVPFETSLGAGVSSNTLALNSAGSSYALRFFVENVPPQRATTNAFTFSAADRGRQQRVDLEVSVASPDTDGNGLPDWWEQRYFGDNANPAADSDQDGLNNYGEYRAGTNPTNAASAFAFINVIHDHQPGLLLQWASVSNHSYSVVRSVDLLGAYLVIQSNVPATPPANAFRDSNGLPARAFYKLLVE